MKAAALVLAALVGTAAVYAGTRTPPVAQPAVTEATLSVIAPWPTAAAEAYEAAVGQLAPNEVRLVVSAKRLPMLVPAVDDRVMQIWDGRTYWQPKDFPISKGVCEINVWSDGKPYAHGLNHLIYHPTVNNFYKYQSLP